MTTLHSFRRLLPALFVALILLAPGCSKDDSTPVTPPDDPVDTTGRVLDKIRPVVFVHGALEAADSWVVLYQWFILNGYKSSELHAFDFVGGMTTLTPDIPSLAATLKTQVEGVIANTGADRVDIVAHGVAAKVVQHYITKLDGVGKVAHVAFCGGVIDAGLTLDGTLTPKPLKFLTLRSDGADAVQGGNAGAGTMTGATNKQLAGLDHHQLISQYAPFAEIFAFFSGASPKSRVFPNYRVGVTYEMKFKVVDFFDNTPVPDANIRYIWLLRGTAERQVPARTFTSDANGDFAVSDLLANYDLEIWISAPNHYDMHIHRQPWRANSPYERLRMIPITGGSPWLQAFRSGLQVDPGTAVAIVHTQNQALVKGRDEATMDDIDILTAGNAPTGAGTTGGNTRFLCLSDYDHNGQSGTGPVSIPTMNTFGVNSFDYFMDAGIAMQTSRAVVNNKIMQFIHWRSGDLVQEKLKGIVLLQFEYF